ncbi:YlmC/YmxH family sporulation protein [Bacillus horti]|uniref:YlmC/YmxH family sporulation protein n=1 Tax=Caldalkalibacillus horti TaxID=77523 RepID=A0ABT9VUU9_9BACI|nr:YlmC/YmxH family sporulation protein [Bacillus horti]MDQ0164766.1 YlmC/YmxH family sporulation protein [Bacillus horti]
MRLSELSGKELIDLNNGERLGLVGQADLTIHEHTGSIESMILPSSSFLSIGKKREEIVIPWRAIRKVGPEMIIIELREQSKVRDSY